MSERYHSSIPLRAGQTVETETFGAPNGKQEHAYEKYREAMRSVRERQPYSPENPTAPFARDLRIEVIDRLGIENTDDFNRVKIYTAVGSPLDIYHGIDAFVEVSEDNGVITVTLDVTTREKDDWKADVLFRLPTDNLDPDLDTDKYLGMVTKVANAVVRKVQDRSVRQLYVDYGEDYDN